jgi:hypothetical protein
MSRNGRSLCDRAETLDVVFRVVASFYVVTTEVLRWLTTWVGDRPMANAMRRAMVRCSATVVGLIAAQLGGCATVATRDLGWGDARASAVVTISNMTPLPVRIYLRRSSVDIALGTVQGLSSRTFEVRDRFIIDASNLQLEARDRRGNVALRSDPFIFGVRRVASWQVDLRSTRVDTR